MNTSPFTFIYSLVSDYADLHFTDNFIGLYSFSLSDSLNFVEAILRDFYLDNFY